MSVNDDDSDSPLVYHEAIGYQIRRGSYLDHSASTYTLAENAVRDGRFHDAAELGRYTVREAVEAHELYRDWIIEIRAFLDQRGVDRKTIDADEKRIRDLIKLDADIDFDPEAGWKSYNAAIEAFASACDAGRKTDALLFLERARQIWRDTHDRKCDWVYGLIDIVARRLGEGCIGELWDVLMAPMYAYYVRYDVDNNPWPRSFDLLMHYALEGLRGHLSGPGRLGTIEVFEESDRWGMRFDPCGSGGRTYRDDPDTGLPPRMEKPFEFGVTTKEYDWAWNKKGICHYCVHCCALNERMPMRRFGYPTRVVEPPTWPAAREGGKCTWYVYKDPQLVPEEIYTRVGMTKPKAIGSSAQTKKQSER
ncbi:MAG: hypothetical protein QM780_04420 [Hyphomicrobium sp.]|uniref:hypothetical protein n=1 Tax=Hyphomicrobium sp. TaxID=82 RepID=UPI0039E51356